MTIKSGDPNCRTKSVSAAGKISGIAPSRLAALQDDDRSSNKDDKEGSSSGDSEERDDGEFFVHLSLAVAE